MSLRERKTVRTRARIIDVALDLMSTQGYDATTMEQVAEVAEVGSSTLYRYFPTKDRLATATFSDRWPGVDLSIADSAPGTTLLAATHAATSRALAVGLAQADRVLAARAMLDQSPVPRARLFDDVEEAYLTMQSELADWADLDAEDLRVRILAREIVTLYGLAVDIWTEHRGAVPIQTIVDDIFAVTPPQLFDLPRRAD